MDTPTDRKLRLFESDFVEFFSNTKWFMIPIVWFPVIIYMLFTASAAVDNFNLGMDRFLYLTIILIPHQIEWIKLSRK